MVIMNYNQQLTTLAQALRSTNEQEALSAARRILALLSSADSIERVPSSLVSSLIALLYANHGVSLRMRQFAGHILSELSPLASVTSLRLASDWSDQHFAQILHVATCQVNRDKNPLQDMVPQLIRWISTLGYSLTLQSRCLAALSAVAQEFPDWLTKDQHHVTDVQMSEWLRRASLQQAPNPFSRSFFRKENAQQPPVTEVEGSATKDLFTLLCVGQFYTNDQVLNLHSFAHALRWLLVDKTALGMRSSSITEPLTSTPLRASSISEFSSESWTSSIAGAENLSKSFPSSQDSESGSDTASEFVSTNSSESPALSMLSQSFSARYSPTESMLSGISKWNEAMEALDSMTSALLNYCLRIMEQNDFRPKVHKDVEVQRASLSEAIRILEVICRREQVVFPHVAVSLRRALSRDAHQCSPRVLISIIQFLLTNSHLLDFDPSPVFDRLFGPVLSKYYYQTSFAFDFTSFIRSNLEKICSKSAILTKYFPNIFKVFAWQPHMFLSDFLDILPACISSSTATEVLHYLFDLPCVTAALEVRRFTPDPTKVRPALQKCSENFSAPQNRALVAFLLRSEAGKGDTIDRMSAVHDILKDLSNSTRVVACAQAVPVLLRRFFEVVLEEGGADTMKHLIPVILERVSLLYPMPDFQSSVRSILEENLLLSFKTYPWMIVDHFPVLRDYLALTSQIQQWESFYMHVMWLIGQYLSSTFDNGCTPDKAAAMYETLEVVCYEIIGSQKAASSEETHICSAKFINVLMSTLAKLASRSQDLIPRVIICLSKLGQLDSTHSKAGSTMLEDHAKELIVLLKVPNVAAVVFSPPIDIQCGSWHRDHTSLSASMYSAKPLLDSQ